MTVPEHIEGFIDADRLLTDVGGTLGARVLSTPGEREPRQAIPDPPGA